MRESKYSVLMVSSQPIQNVAPLQILERDDRAEVLTAYCSLPNKKLWRDHESLTRKAFDIPLLHGYTWLELRNYSPLPRLGKFYGLINPGVIRLVSSNDCCVVFGHSYVSFWLAIAAAKLCGKPLLLTTDATYLDSQYGGRWKTSIKKKFLPYLYNRIADMVLVPSTASERFIRSIGVDESRVVITPYVVDNDYIAEVAARTDRKKVREEWRVPEEATVLVFCAKFLARKRPQDALRAFARANVPNSYLVMVGEGPLADSLKKEVEEMGLSGRVRFPGLVKYSRLPEAYAASDALVFPSEHEPYGLPVNEAMICGIPAIVSDRVGAGLDLVEHAKTGFVYRSGDVDGLASILREVLPDRELLRRLGENARRRMQTWSPRDNAEATLKAVERAINSRRARSNS
ncbi:MAG TPA: glycosyltransferase family 4 protein [Blastocatellia bacterium]